MGQKNNSALFFTCSLIEQIGRDLHLHRGDVVRQIGAERIRILLDNADILHCEPLEKVADDVSREYGLRGGDYDNVSACRHTVPSAWDMGKVYSRLIEDVDDDNQENTLWSVYTSWMDELLCNYNSDLYYQPREYLAECWQAGEIIDD